MTKTQLANIRRLNKRDKLELMEVLWEELSTDASAIPTPDWHKQILSDRLEKIKSGKTKLISSKEVKRKFKFA